MLPRDKQRLLKIEEYCEDIQAAVHRHDNSFEIFQTDLDFRYSVSFCILQIGELANGLSDTFRDSTKDKIQWRQIKAMRNIVVHDYGNIDLENVWSVVKLNIPELKQFCSEQLSCFE